MHSERGRTVGPEGAGKNLEIAWTVDPKLPERVLGDESRIRQILLNLISNAVKFTDRGGICVRVTGEMRGPSCTLSIAVQDTGIGLSAQDMRGLFGEFEQADAAVHRQVGGTGLGLAISKRLAAAMGGDITVESTPGEGSTFTAQLQLTPEPPARNAKPAAPVLPCRVMLAFDHMIERQGLADILSGAVASVVQSDLSSAADLAQACAEQGRPFDRVIVDVGSDPVAAGRLLAHVSGLSGGNRVRGLVLVSALSRASLAAFRAQGFDAYLVKPVRPAAILVQLADDRAQTAPSAALAHSDMSQNKCKPAVPVKCRVLLAEDNEINALLARRVIERTGGEVHWARNGHEAVSAMRGVLSWRQRGFRPHPDGHLHARA